MSATGDLAKPEGPWNPGVLSQMPRALRPLSTMFRPDNVYTSIAAAEELSGLTGLSSSELAVFRPRRLALHELLIRVTADFAVPDGSRIEDLGINFRRMAGRILSQYLEPEMHDITAAFERARLEITQAVEAALAAVVPVGADAPGTAARGAGRRLFARARARRSGAAAAVHGWGPAEIDACWRRADASRDPMQRLACQCLGRVLSALFVTHGGAWGTRELIVSIARDLALNQHGSDAVGRRIEPLLLRAAQREGYGLLPIQARPVVINTKGASASGKSTLRPLQKKLAGEIGVNWSDFALISPDIWRKQLLDYGSLGEAYKYAGAFTADELHIVDGKLDRYMARKHLGGGMTHLLIDRFRFDSFAPDSEEAGSNLLTRFGQTVYLFFVITPPELLVERAWKRGLEVGRYKAVDDTLAHAVAAYRGIPDLFFTWIDRGDKLINFEFLDNAVPLGELPRTVAFGGNDIINVLHVGRLLDIERYGRVSIDAAAPERLYPDLDVLAAELNTRFLRRCVAGFRRVNFADPRTGQIYLRIESGAPVFADAPLIESALRDPDTLAGVRAVCPGALRGEVSSGGRAHFVERAEVAPTLGMWGDQPRKSQ